MREAVDVLTNCRLGKGVLSCVDMIVLLMDGLLPSSGHTISRPVQEATSLLPPCVTRFFSGTGQAHASAGWGEKQQSALLTAQGSSAAEE